MRRFVIVLALAFLMGLGCILAVNHLSYSAFDPARVQTEYEQQITNCERARGSAGQRDETPSEPGASFPLPPGAVDEGFIEEFSCRDQFGADAAEYAQRYGYDHRYRAVDELPSGVMGTGMAFAAVAFLMGATFIGPTGPPRRCPGC